MGGKTEAKRLKGRKEGEIKGWKGGNTEEQRKRQK